MTEESAFSKSELDVLAVLASASLLERAVDGDNLLWWEDYPNLTFDEFNDLKEGVLGFAKYARDGHIYELESSEDVVKDILKRATEWQAGE